MLTSSDFTMSSDPSKDAPRLQSPSSPPIDADSDNYGDHSSASDPVPRISRHSPAQSPPGIAADGGRNANTAGTISAQDRRASSATLVQRVGTTLSVFLSPKCKVGKAPGLTRQLRTILFGSCASHAPAFPTVWCSDMARQGLTFSC